MPQRRPRSSPRRSPKPRLSPLRQRLQEALAEAKRIAVLGVGAELRGDDFAGVLVAMKVRELAKKKRLTNIQGFVGASAPENVTGEVVGFKPTHVVLVDAAHLGKKPGEVDVVQPEDIGGVSFSTHMLPAPIILDYLKKGTGCQVLVVGIQPASTEFMGEVAPSVRKTVKALADGLVAQAAR